MARPCQHWANFKCNFGDRCSFSHDGPGGPSPLGEFPGAGQGGAPQQAAQGFGGGGGGGRPCQHWANFKCNFGDRCQFSHDGPGGPSPLGEYTGKGGGGGGGDFQQAGGAGAAGQPSDNVFVSQLPSGLNEDLVNQLFSQYGTVTSVKIVSKPDQDGTAALVRFATEAEAAFIVEGMNGNIPQGLTTPVQTKFAGAPTGGGGKGGFGGGGFGGGGVGGGAGGADRSSPYPQTTLPGKGLGKPGDIPMEQIVRGLEESGGLPGGDGRDKSQMIEVFVFGLPADTTDLHLYRMFAPFGQIAPKGANVMTDGSGGCKGFGFVNFLAIESAQLAIQTLNGAILPNKRVLKVEIKAAGKGGGSQGMN